VPPFRLTVGMTLKNLAITLNTYGIEKGSYDVSITVMEHHSEITMKLPPEASHAFVAHAKDMIHKFTVRAADQLHAELQLAEPPPLNQIAQ